MTLLQQSTGHVAEERREDLVVAGYGRPERPYKTMSVRRQTGARSHNAGLAAEVCRFFMSRLFRFSQVLITIFLYPNN